MNKSVLLWAADFFLGIGAVSVVTVLLKFNGRNEDRAGIGRLSVLAMAGLVVGLILYYFAR